MKTNNMDSLYRLIMRGKLIETYSPTSTDEEKEINYYRGNIERYCNSHNCDKSSVIKGLMSFPEFRFIFEKNPKKQSREEAQQYEIIKSVYENNVEKETGYSGIKIGRSSGKGSGKEFEFRVNENGKILKGSRLYDSDPESKTFDTVMALEKNNRILDVYIAQKDTGSGSQNSVQGGTQSSVGEEMGKAARYCKENNDNALFAFYLDSSYWHTKKKSRKETEFEHFKAKYQSKNILVTNSECFKEDFINHLNKHYGK